MSHWLSIVGLSEVQDEPLTRAAAKVIDNAEAIFGSDRLLARVPHVTCRKYPWASPLSDTIDKVMGLRGRSVVILATGDPTYFGIGSTMMHHVPASEMQILPAPSAFSLACARLGWPQQDIVALSLHGRPAEHIRSAMAPGARIVALTSNGATVHEIADILTAGGFEGSQVWVLENMAGDGERITETTAGDAGKQTFGDFNTVAIDCVASPNTHIQANVPGLPDDAFEHDGQLTKREVRAATLSALAPMANTLLWDVGAGAGSIAIEWMRSAAGARAIAFEINQDRCATIIKNAEQLGVPELEVICGEAPAVLHRRESPHAIFIGGGLSNRGIFEACWQALKPGGRLVANVVTMESELQIMRLQQAYGGELSRIAISRLKPVGNKNTFKPLVPVTQWCVMKPVEAGD